MAAGLIALVLGLVAPLAADGPTADELAGAIWIEGHLQYRGPRALADGAVVFARGRAFPSGALHRVELGGDSAFRVAFAPGTEVAFLELESPNFVLDPVPVDLATPDRRVRLRPKVVATVAVELVPPAGVSRDELAGVELQLWVRPSERGEGPVTLKATASTDSRAEFEHVPLAKEAVLTCRPPGRPQTRLDGLSFPSGGRHELRLTLAGGVRVSGRVSDEEGAPIEGAVVWAGPPGFVPGQPLSSGFYDPVFTEPDGTFDLRFVGERVDRVSAFAPGFVPMTQDVDLAASEGGLEVHLTARRGETIEGVLLDGDERPVAGEWVGLRVSHSGEGRDEGCPYAGTTEMDKPAGSSRFDFTHRYVATFAFTDERGAFRFEGLSSGRVDLMVSSDSRGGGEQRALVENLVPGSTGPVVLRTLVASGSLARAIVEGTVVNGQGHPVPGARVTATGIDDDGALSLSVPEPSARTDGAGRFALPLEPGSVAKVLVRKRGFARFEEHVRAGALDRVDLPVVLTRGATVRGVALLADGRPAAGHTVWAYSEFSEAILDRRTDASGEFQFARLAPGIWTLELEERGTTTSLTQRSVTVTDGETAEVELRVAAGPFEVRGVVHVGGTPPGGGQVVLDHGLPEVAPAPIGADGTFTLTVPRSGWYDLAVQHGNAEYLSSRHLRPGEASSLELELAVGALEGRVVDERGRPLPNVGVAATVRHWLRPDRAPADDFTLTDDEGRFRFPQLTPGEYLVFAGPNTEARPDPTETWADALTTGVQVTEGGTTALEDLVMPDRRRVEGVVVDRAGRPVRGARVFSRLGGVLLEVDPVAVTDEHGRFTLERVSAATELLAATLFEASTPAPVGDADELRFELEPATLLRVRVHDERGLCALPCVAVLDADGVEVPARQEGLLDFGLSENAFGPVRPGTYRIVGSTGLAGPHEATIEVDGEPELELDLRLE